MTSVSRSAEYSEHSMPNPSTAGEAYQSAGRDRRKGHQTISTATYYQAERRGVGYGYEGTQDLEADGETGDV